VNGTLVNDKAADRVRLHHGDQIRVGEFRAEFRDLPHPFDTAQPPPGTVPVEDALEVRPTMNVSASLDASSQGTAIPKRDARRTEKHLKTFFLVSRALTVCTDDESLFSRILQCLLDVFPQASRAYVLMGNDIDNLVEKGRLSRHQEQAPAEAMAISTTILKHVLGEREAILSRDAGADRRFTSGESIIQQNIRTMMCTPLIAQDETFGVLEVDSERINAPFGEEDLELLVGVAAQIALFLRNLKLMEAAAAERARRRQLQMFFSPAVAKNIIENEISLGGELRNGV